MYSASWKGVLTWSNASADFKINNTNRDGETFGSLSEGTAAGEHPEVAYTKLVLSDEQPCRKAFEGETKQLAQAFDEFCQECADNDSVVSWQSSNFRKEGCALHESILQKLVACFGTSVFSRGSQKCTGLRSCLIPT